MPDSPSDPGPDSRHPSLTERWWWRGALWIVAGGAVAWYQRPVIQDGTAIWANWLMVAVGVVLAGLGAVRLWRAWQVQQRQGLHDDSAHGPAGTPPTGSAPPPEA